MYRTSISRRCSFGSSISRHRYGATTNCLAPARLAGRRGHHHPDLCAWNQAGVSGGRILGGAGVATSHVFLWYGRRVLFDSTLTFLVTLALFAWIHVQLLGRSSRWYLLAFVSMALGAMLKEMRGFFSRCW